MREDAEINYLGGKLINIRIRSVDLNEFVGSDDCVKRGIHVYRTAADTSDLVVSRRRH